jgi:Ca-activated chloride channel family protein
VTPLVAAIFATPGRVWLLVVVAALVAVYVWAQSRRPRYTVRFTNLALVESVAPRRPGWQRHAASLAFSVGLALLVVAFAHPQRSQKVPTNRATVVLAIDTSLSMKADDVSPSRIEAAKEAASLFLDNVPVDMNVGIVTFNGTAVVRVAPTKDRVAARDAIERLQLGERTAIGEAVFASLEAVKTVPPAPDGSPVPARIVLMSDGATTTGRSNDEASAAAREANVPVDTIAFGTDMGSIQLPGDPTPIPVTVDRASLKAIAGATGGQSFTAASAAEIRDVYKKIGRSIGYRTVRKDVSGWFEGGALVLLLVAGGISIGYANRLP